MAFRVSETLAKTVIGAACLLLPASSLAQRPPVDSSGGKPTSPSSSQPTSPSSGTSMSVPQLVVYVQEESGGPIGQMALVSVTRTATQSSQQRTTLGGQASFDNVPSGRYTVQVIAAGYMKLVEDIEVIGGVGVATVYVTVTPESPGRGATPVAPGPPLLAPKAQKELWKAIEALRTEKLAEARTHLDAVYRLAPSHPDVNFLFGVYSSMVNDRQEAKSYLEKAIALYPQHALARVCLSSELLRENKPADATLLLKKALEIQPNSWTAHALLADADLRLGKSEEAIREAERAIELGGQRAARVRPALARALVVQGKVDRAIQVLESYLRENPSDTAAQMQLASLRKPPAVRADSSAPTASAASVTPAGSLPDTAVLPLPSIWLPTSVGKNQIAQHCGVDQDRPAQRFFAVPDEQHGWQEYRSIEDVPELELGIGQLARLWAGPDGNALIRVEEPGEDFSAYTDYCFEKTGGLMQLRFELRTAWGWGYREEGPVVDGALAPRMSEFFGTKNEVEVAKPEDADDIAQALKPHLYTRKARLPFARLLSK